MQMRRHKVGQLYWIDCLCIDQNAHSEKQLQVSRMSDIYANAAMVAACIGAGGPREQYFKEDQRHIFNNVFAHNPRQELFRWMSSLSYFNRLWTVQECELARALHIFCGNQEMDVAVLHDDLVQYLNDLARDPPGRADFGHVRSIVSLIGNRYHAAADGWSLADLVNTYASRRCHDPRDKVYGLLALTTAEVRAHMPISYGATLLEVLLSYTRLHDHFKFREQNVSFGPVSYLQRILASTRRLGFEFWHASDEFRRDHAEFLSKQAGLITKAAFNDCSRSSTDTDTSRTRISFSLFGRQDISLYRRYDFLRGSRAYGLHKLVHFDANEPLPQLPGPLTRPHIISAVSNSHRHKSLLANVLHRISGIRGTSTSFATGLSGPGTTDTSSTPACAPSTSPLRLLIISEDSRDPAILEVPAETTDSDVLLECTGSSVPQEFAPMYLVGRPQRYGQCDILGRAYHLRGAMPIFRLSSPVIDVTTCINPDDLVLLAAAPQSLELVTSLLISRYISPPSHINSDHQHTLPLESSATSATQKNEPKLAPAHSRRKPQQSSLYRPRWSGAIAKHIRLRHGIGSEIARKRRIGAETLGYRSERVFLAGEHEPKLKDCTAFG